MSLCVRCVAVTRCRFLACLPLGISQGKVQAGCKQGAGNHIQVVWVASFTLNPIDSDALLLFHQ